MSNKESLTVRTFKGFFWSVGGKVLTTFVQIGVLAVLARLINAESFGIIQSALVVVGFAKIVGQIGIGPALVQIKYLTEKHVKVGYTFSLAMGFILALGVYLISNPIAYFFSMNELSLVLKYIAIVFLFESIITVSSALLQRELKLNVKVTIEFVSYFFGYGLIGIVLGYMGYDYWALVIAIISQSFFKLIAYIILQKHSFGLQWNNQEFFDLIQFAGGYSLGKVSSYFALQADNIIIGRHLGAESLGVYSRAYAIMTKPASMIGDALNLALFPAMSARQDQQEKLSMVFVNGSKMILFVSIIFSFVIVSSANEIVSVLLGHGWEEAILPLQILSAGLFFRLGYKLGAELSKATGNVNKQGVYLFIYAIVSVIGSYLGVYWGIVGVAFGILTAIVINYFLMTHLGLGILKIRWRIFLKNIFPEILLSFLLGTVYVLVLNSARSFIYSDYIVLAVSLLVYFHILLMLFYYHGRKLSFIDIVPFKKFMNKFMNN
ncbi:MAG: lipopolysaccharide biosynthesis protein [Balneolales bacterium]|nr:lipopolysaccharide biosynthesis protein [Balneolales bacterium]